MPLQKFNKATDMLRQLLKGNVIPPGEAREELEKILALTDQAAAGTIFTDQFFTQFGESYPRGMLLLDYAGCVTFWNKELENITGYPENEMNGMSIWEIYKLLSGDPVLYNSKKAEYNRLFELLLKRDPSKTAPVVFTDKIKRKNGSTGFQEFCAFPVDANGTRLVCVTVRDVAEEQRKNSKLQLLSLAVEQSPAPILITDARGLIEYVNKSFVRLFGYTPDEVIGRNPRMLKSEKTPPATHESLWKSISSGEVWQGEVLDRRKDGSYIWLLASISPLKNSYGETESYISMYEDITHIKQMQSDLRRALEFSEEANSLKASILNNISHELRTPMNGILGYAQILSEEVTDPSLKVYSDKIIRSGNRLLNTLNSLINLSELEANKMSMNPDPVHIAHLVRTSVAGIEKTIREKGLSFDLIIFENDLYCALDTRFIRKILSELLDNAIKFTENGSIRISIFTDKPEGDENRSVVIAISDTGLGVPLHLQEMIFREFRQVSEGYSRRFEGRGLGLTIARKFARLMGGDISLDSKPGEGSTFYLRFPAVSPDEMINLNENSSVSSILRQQTILLLTRSSADYHLIEYYLKGMCRVFPANSPEEALTAAMNNKFNAVMIDINFDERSRENNILAHIKQLPDYSVAPFIAISGFSNEFDEDTFTEEGYTAVITKPIDRYALIKLFNNLAHRQSNSQ